MGSREEVLYHRMWNLPRYAVLCLIGYDIVTPHTRVTETAASNRQPETLASVIPFLFCYLPSTKNTLTPNERELNHRHCLSDNFVIDIALVVIFFVWLYGSSHDVQNMAYEMCEAKMSHKLTFEVRDKPLS